MIHVEADRAGGQSAFGAQVVRERFQQLIGGRGSSRRRFGADHAKPANTSIRHSKPGRDHWER